MRNHTEGKETKNELRKSTSSSDVRKYIKAFISVFFSFFALMLCITIWVVNNISTAWFASNRTVSGSSMSVSVEDSNMVQVDLDNFLIMGYKDNGADADPRYSIYSLKYKKDSDNDHSMQTSQITMLPYDFINSDNKNDRTPLVVQIPIKGTAVEAGEALSIKLSIEENNNWYTTTEDNKKKMSEILSNIIEVRCIVPDSSEQGEDLWKAITGANAQDTQKYVVEWNEENPQKEDTLEFEVSGYTKPGAGGSLNVYLVIDYNDDLVQKYTNTQDLKKIKFGTEVVKADFAYDFTNLNVSILPQQ